MSAVSDVRTFQVRVLPGSLCVADLVLKWDLDSERRLGFSSSKREREKKN